jgi:hypothetical protein
MSITFGGDFPLASNAGQFPMFGEGNMTPLGGTNQFHFVDSGWKTGGRVLHYRA